MMNFLGSLQSLVVRSKQWPGRARSKPGPQIARREFRRYQLIAFDYLAIGNKERRRCHFDAIKAGVPIADGAISKEYLQRHYRPQNFFKITRSDAKGVSRSFWGVK